MKRLLFFLMATLFAMQGFSQATLNEGFEGTTFPPDDWAKVTTQGTEAWERYTSDAPRDTACASVNYDNPSHINYLITPKLVVSSDQDSISFWIKCPTYYSGTTFSVLVSTTNNDVTSFSTTSLLTISTFPETWTRYSVSLANYIGEEIHVAFKVVDDFGSRVMLDDVEGPELFVPSCPSPRALTLSNPTTIGIDLGWTDDTGLIWNIEYMLATETDWTNATTLYSVMNPHTFTSLNASTSYKARVQTDCGIEQSDWTSPITFMTACDAITVLPYSDSFDTYGTVTGSFPPCWSRPVLNSTTPFPSIETTNNSAPASIKFRTVTTTPTYSVTPAFTADLNTLMVSFWLKAEGVGSSQSGTITVGVMSNPNDITTFEAVQLISPSTTDWIEYRIMLAGIQLQGSGNYIAFKHNSNADNWFYWLDDVEVDEIPACPNTYDLTSTILSATSVELDWMDNGNSIGWIIAYGDSTGFDPSTTTQTIVLSSTDPIPYIVSNLTPQTPYSFAVRQNCDDGAWSNIVTIVTPAIAATLPYTHDFENVTENNAWTFINGTQTNQWFIGTAADTLGTTGLYISNDAGVSNAYTVGTSRVYAYRDFEVPTGAGELELSFDWRAQGGAAQNDFLRMYLVPLDANITAGNIPAGGLDISAQIGNYAGLGEHWLSMSNVWQHKTMRINSIQFPNLAGRTWRLLVHWRNQSSTTTDIQPPAAVDNIQLSVVLCPTPSALVASNPTTTSIDLAWQENGQATDWIIEYKENSSSTWNQVNANSNPYTLTGLNNSSTYQARVRSLCSANDTSLTSLTISFNTACDIITVFPWSEGFETSWIASQAPGNASAPNCWTNINKGSGSSNIWSRGTTAHSGSGAAQMYTDNSNQNNDWLISPLISLTGNERLRFWAQNNSAATSEVDEISIWISDGIITSIDTTNMGVYDSIQGFIQIYQTGVPIGPWQEYEINLNQYSGDRYIAFVRRNTPDNGWYLRLDDVLIDALPSCAKPTNVVSVNSNQNDIEIGWTNGNTTDASWYVYYRPSGATDYDSVLANSNPYILGGLTSATTYDIYVRTNCGTELSEASPVVNFATTCYAGAISTFPWTEGFESGLICWTISSSVTSANWKSISSGTWPTATPHSESNMIMFNSTSISSGEWSTLYSPLLDFPNDQYQISFWLFRDNADYLTTADRVELYVNSTASETGATLLGTVNRSFSLAPIETSGGWYQYTFNLPAGMTGNNYVMLKGISSYGRNVYVDDLMVDGLGDPCPAPTNITVTSSNTSANVTWTAGDAETSWEVRLGTTGTPEVTSITNHPLTGLTPSTAYTVYVRANCGTGYSTWVSAQFTTTSLPTPPTVTTTTATAITTNQATLNGTITVGTDPITAQGFEYKTQASNTWIDQVVATGTTPFTYTLTGLSSGTAYQARAYANTATDGRIYGNEITFTTITVVSPIVTTEPITNITQSSATFNGTITENTEAIEARGFEYKLSSEAWEDAVNISATGTTTISANATNLDNTLEYNVRAYARTASGKTYGSIISFQLLSLNGATGQEISVMIYPNPATSQTNLVVNGINGETKIVLSDVQGRILNTINTKPLSGKLEQTIDLSNLAKGVYYIRIQNSDINRTQKLIVK